MGMRSQNHFGSGRIAAGMKAGFRMVVRRAGLARKGTPEQKPKHIGRSAVVNNKL
jgi:hypothetical protein